MITIKQAIILAAQEIKSDSAMLDARILLEFTLSKTREQIFMEHDDILSASDYQKYQELVQRRCLHEPIAKIIGYKEFYGREFITTKDTLDPRPDSEVLIDIALTLLPDNAKILDLGTGTGCLPITLLCERGDISAVAADISPKALDVASCNAKNLGVANRIEYICSDWFANIEGGYDVIISNPPYIAWADKDNLEFADYEPHNALFANDNGLADYREILSHATKYLNDNGCIIFEIGHNQEKEIDAIAQQYNLKTTQYAKDIAGIIRCLVITRN